ncbi:glycosyltransferase [Clostridium baratii]|uniref:glycosyltransferase n=1 Tax=Clostridium baratii TaxID=1561 RepID=UPI0030CE20A2
MSKLVSVIVPVYNVEKYLDKCINSIINQTYRNLEIILIDDGSTDNSGKKCDYWAGKDRRIKVIHKENGGLSDARNIGIANAEGEYISFIDSDDFIDLDMIEYLLNILIKNNCQISICDFRKIYENTSKEYSIKYKKEKISVYSNIESIRYLLKDKKIQNYAWNKLYLKKLFTDECYYPYGRKMEDIGTTYLLFYNANRIAVSNQSKYNYLQRKGSIVNNEDIKFIIDKYELSEKRFNEINKRNIYLIENYVDYTNKFLEIYRKNNIEIKKYIKENNVVEKFFNNIKNREISIFIKVGIKTKIKLLFFYLQEGIK